MKRITDFYTTWQFLENHPMFQYAESSMLHHCLEIEVVKVNPRTNRVDDDERENTATRVWLECGPYLRPEELSAEERRHLPHGIPSVDLQLSCGAPTFEEAIIKLANRVARRYGRSRHPRRRLRKTLTREERAVRKAYQEYRAGKGRPAEEVWAELRRYGTRQARKLGIKETNVERIIDEYRKGR